MFFYAIRCHLFVPESVPLNHGLNWQTKIMFEADGSLNLKVARGGDISRTVGLFHISWKLVRINWGFLCTVITDVFLITLHFCCPPDISLHLSHLFSVLKVIIC